MYTMPKNLLSICVNFALATQPVSLHRLTEAELRRWVRPIRAASFSAPTDRGARTAQACSPLTGGKFFAEPQRGVALCEARESAAPAAGAKRKGHLRFPFLFELLPFPYFLVWRKSETSDRCEIEERQRIFLCYGRTTFGVRPLKQPVRSVGDHTATQAVLSPQARHNSVAQILGTL